MTQPNGESQKIEITNLQSTEVFQKPNPVVEGGIRSSLKTKLNEVKAQFEGILENPTGGDNISVEKLERKLNLPAVLHPDNVNNLNGWFPSKEQNPVTLQVEQIETASKNSFTDRFQGFLQDVKTEVQGYLNSQTENKKIKEVFESTVDYNRMMSFLKGDFVFASLSNAEQKIIREVVQNSSTGGDVVLDIIKIGVPIPDHQLKEFAKGVEAYKPKD